MPHDVIMPALGMAQDTGKLVSWLKQQGEAVAIGDPIMEVETDKTTMEVEAQASGFLIRIAAKAGDDVPVGQVVAVIAKTADSEAVTKVEPVPAASPPADREPIEIKTPADTLVKTPARQVATPTPPKGRVLASPKVRRLALEQGLDLARLAEHGVSQPYHVADLVTLKALGPAEALPAPKTDPTAPAAMHIAARVLASGCDELVAWMASDGEVHLAPRLIWLRFATAALREATGRHEDPIVVETSKIREVDGRFVDADRSSLSRPGIENGDCVPALVLRDFTASPIVSITAPVADAPVLTIGRERDDYLISLDYRTCQLEEGQAIDLVTDFAARLGEPLGHIV